MSSDEDDYLSAKFLENVEAASKSGPKNYSQIRKERQKISQLKQEQNRLKSRREREIESREEGLSKSLFERAREEEDAGLVSGNSKALSMMMKMGFKPGQSLGAKGAEAKFTTSGVVERERSSTPGTNTVEAPTSKLSPIAGPSSEAETPRAQVKPHITEPIPLREWTGKQGIGLGKRARSPDASERIAKMARMAEQADQRDFRERARDDYNNRRAEGRLGPAQRTCGTLDEEMGKEFNVLWLNPNNETTFPSGLIDALAFHGNLPGVNLHLGSSSTVTGAMRERLRIQMQAEALVPIAKGDDVDQGLEEEDSKSLKAVSAMDQFTPEILAEATSFLSLQAQDRLRLVLSYLRSRHHYCFWCGIKYADEEELEAQCPGPEEDDHD